MKIEKSKYQGYLWYSDKNEPNVILDEEFELEISDDENPFVIEGQLFDGKTSISIKYVDGKYIVRRYNLSELDGVVQDQVFLSHRMDNRQLKFKLFWKEQSDELCSNMGVYQPAEFVFVGFKNKEE